MALLAPFRALRPTPDRAAAVAAPPYDVVTTEEARALAAGNPLNFLHVSRAEIDLPSVTNPYDDAVYAQARVAFNRLRAEAPLSCDERPQLYVYQLQTGAHVQTGVAGCFSVDEYEQDVIKKHERTRRDKEDDRTRHILALRAQTGPVFLVFRQRPDVRRLVDQVASQPPLFEFVAADDVRHTVWVVPKSVEAALIDAFRAIPALYIADGHHRAASAARARHELPTGSDPGEWGTFLAVAFPDAHVRVLPYNRVVKDLRGSTAEGLLRELRARFHVGDGTPTPGRRGEVQMFLDGRWYTIDLKPPDDHTGTAADRLDVSLLQDRVLAPLLGIGDVRTDPRIDFIGGSRGTRELERQVRSGQAAVAFSLFPVTIGDLMAISDEGGIMPPKSTWFEPKLRDGLLIHVV